MFMRAMLVLTTAATLCLGSASAMASATPGPHPGDVYREYRQVMLDNTWRVIDPGTEQPDARVDLPNAVHHITITDLTDAVRAEAVIDFWGGHYRTSGKQIRFNNKAWMPVPELTTTPPGQLPSSYMQQFNPVIEVPLSHLRLGDNTFEGICGDQIDGFGWGQWGWYGLILRVYYGPSKPHPSGRVIAPIGGATLSENPLISVAAESPVGVARVDVLGLYDGMDENGDGIFRDWHHLYHYTSISGHIGTVTSAPYQVTWDTRWVPDQAIGMAVLARIQDTSGVWYVTQPVDGLTLERPDVSVKLYRPSDVPPLFSVRDDASQSCTITIPEGDDLGLAREAALHLRTWNGADESVTLNAWQGDIAGANHNYAGTVRPFPVTALRPGANRVSFHSVTVHHGVEILWPGPVITVRYAMPRVPPTQSCRLPISVSAAGWARRDAIVEVPLDFTALLKSVDLDGALEQSSLRVVEVGDSGTVLDSAVDFQFDGDPGHEMATDARGTLVLLMEGWTDPDVTRYYDVYFDVARSGPYAPMLVAPRVRVTDDVDRAGQASFRIETDGGTYYYQKAGGGFASLEDEQGNDWIGFRPIGGSEGSYRGIPNLAYPEGYFHPGSHSALSRLRSSGPVKASIQSQTRDGKWACQWDIYPTHATMTVLKADHPYWFLYEGTPAGQLDPAFDYWRRSDGASGPASQEWTATLPSPQWVYFAKPGIAARVLYLARCDPGTEVTSYRPMQGQMTVFGFGRRDTDTPQAFLSTTPARFIIGLAPASVREVQIAVDSAIHPVGLVVGDPRQSE